MFILLILFVAALFLGLIIWAGHRINRSETADVISRSICLSAGVHDRD
ncbi:MAG: hypothetical protein WAM60_01105 [Candidatus Promineifilaceae bacterium]